MAKGLPAPVVTTDREQLIEPLIDTIKNTTTPFIAFKASPPYPDGVISAEFHIKISEIVMFQVVEETNLEIARDIPKLHIQ